MGHEILSVVPSLPGWSLVARIIHESAAQTVDIIFLPGVLPVLSYSYRAGEPGAPPLSAAEVNTALPPVTVGKAS